MTAGTIRIKASGNLANVIVPMQVLASPKTRQGLARALNHTLGKVETQVNRALVKQTGLKHGAVKAAMKRYSANAGTLQGEILGRGGFTSLAQFGARQTRKGVSAAPWAKRRLFLHTFFVQRYGGGVFKRTGGARFPVKKLYGPAIPREMVKDQSAAAFARSVAAGLPPRVQHELARLLKR